MYQKNNTIFYENFKYPNTCSFSLLHYNKIIRKILSKTSRFSIFFFILFNKYNKFNIDPFFPIKKVLRFLRITNNKIEL